MIVKVTIHNTNDDIFLIANSKSKELLLKGNKLYVHTKHGAFIDGTELIEEFNTSEQCEMVYKKIKKFINRKREIKETINLTIKDIKMSNTKDEREIFKSFLWNRERELLKYDDLYIKDIK
ncbi:MULTISPECIES: hypothetical protein [unclassified Clostridium]|uniref:hypothetical protein n=1 Tax=unclassified Clostridium TaxID=2614128 RepID=UPI0013F9DC17|nr:MULTISPECIES: hypothetical protein [unclassified Clostridium]NFR85784.1 hypothetical protein [Clostridium botulinum]NFR91418.1 hypothetical protein [Clostridium botulinum]NFT99315.1 hypothetical protein [Clostridium botulinum]